MSSNFFFWSRYVRRKEREQQRNIDVETAVLVLTEKYCLANSDAVLEQHEVKTTAPPVWYLRIVRPTISYLYAMSDLQLIALVTDLEAKKYSYRQFIQGAIQTCKNNNAQG